MRILRRLAGFIIEGYRPLVDLVRSIKKWYLWVIFVLVLAAIILFVILAADVLCFACKPPGYSIPTWMSVSGSSDNCSADT